VRTDKKSSQKADKKAHSRVHNRGVVGYSKKSALLEEAITHMNTGKYGRSSAALKELLTLDPHNTEARRLFATLHLRLGSLVTARQAFESLANEAIGRQDFWLAESLLREYLAAGPRCVPFLELLAHVQEEKGDSMAAVAELGKAIEILIEDPDSEDPKKPSQLYAKVRELAPASPVAFQFASLFDIQTGELLVPSPLASVPETSLKVESSQPQGEILATTQEARASDVMPWEQFDGTFPTQETPPLTSANLVIESLDVPGVVIESAPVRLPPQDMEVPPSESTGLIEEANCFDKEMPPSIVAEPSLPSSGQPDDMAEAIVESSKLVEEESTTSSSEERATDVAKDIASSAGSPGLPTPMPWEQIETSTVRIEEATPAAGPVAQSDGTSLLGDSVPAPSPTTEPAFVSGQLSSTVPAPDLTEPSESIFAVEPSTNPVVLPGPEAPTPSTPDSSPTVPFSWNTVFDGAWKFDSGTLSSSSPAVPPKPDMDSSQGAKDVESIQSESLPESALLSPSTTSTPEPHVSFSDSEPLPSAHLSIVNQSSGSIVESDAIRTSDLPQPILVRRSDEPSQPAEPPISSIGVPNSFNVDIPVPPLSKPVEPARESESVSFPSFVEPQPVALVSAAPTPEPSRSAVISEVPPTATPASVSTEHREIPFTLLKAALAPPASVAPSDAPSESPAPMDTLSRWDTGEVEVQRHRPSEKKRNWDKEKGEAPVDLPASLPPVEESSAAVAELSRSGGWESVPSEANSVVEPVVPILEKVVPQEDTRPEWVRASESISFVNLPPSSPVMWQDPDVEPAHSKSEPTLSVAASAVDVLFDSTGERSQVSTRDRLTSPRPRPRFFATKVARVRIGISSFIGSCFSTTRSIVLLCVGLALSCVALVTVGIGAVVLAWMVMETPPSPVYHDLTISPPLALTDSRKNGYFLLLGFDASGEQDPLQAGYNRKVEATDLQAASACMLGDDGKGSTGAAANGVHGVFTSADPVAQLKPQATAIRSWVAQESLALRRYQQWLGMPFEDVGYGQILSPNCAHILLAHRLYLAEGFTQDLSTGLGRLETDMGSWRAVMGQSKTLMVKMLAATAVQDDAAIASGLLTRQDLDGTAIGRLGKVVRPFDQVELSLRWPMQSHLLWATKAVTTSLRNDKANERPLYAALAAAMPLPVQRRSNAYADYYEAASKAVAEGRYTNLPNLSSFIRTPADSALDYVANPIEHIIGIEALPSWDPYVGRMVETDARLRLASLQVWLRQGAQDGNVVTRLAKAGQAHYDPFTGLPMLVNQQKGVMYSVGKDGKDQEGDPLRDVVAAIPKTQSVVTESSRFVPPPRSK
jgi:tetratricopeptide repeat protein